MHDSTPVSITDRRGMLLLVVILMLSLFMAMGAMLLTVALRARASARAFSQATLATSLNDSLARDALDEALMTLLRGGTNADGSVITGTYLESILADKYGASTSGTGSGLSGTASSVLSLNISATGIAPNSLGGRLLTIKPRNPDDGDIATFRILGTSSTASGIACYLENSPSPVARRFPSQSRLFDVIINGREFTPRSELHSPEGYDAYDDNNKWLAQPVIASGDVVNFKRLSFTGSLPTLQTGSVDNDNDGVPDGVWIPAGDAPPPNTPIVSGTIIASRNSPLGGKLTFQVSYLVLDLDGRINVNAAGISARGTGSYIGSEEVPLGMGYGPADVDASLLFTGTLPATTGTSAFTGSGTAAQPDVYWIPLAIGTGSGANSIPRVSGSLPRGEQRGSPPQLGPIVGRYGLDAKPGYDDASLGLIEPYPTLSISGNATPAPYSMLVAGTNTVADLQGRNRVYMTSTASQITPTLTFFSVTTATTAALAAAADARDNPYQARLNGRPAGNDQPFTVAELERVLRPFDADAPVLPQRLAAGLSDYAQRSRMTVTTDSWDTPALTGTAATTIETALAGLPITHSAAAWRSSANKSNSVSPDIAAGLRFNINRPIASPSDAYEFCKDLYCLVRLLGVADSKRAAQWAVNVLEFRDADSILTGFEYDKDISDGWDVDGDLATDEGEPIRGVAWGVERPEMLITETLAYGDELWVVLHRPWNAAVQTFDAPTRAIEIVDPKLAAGPNALSLNGWRLRLDNDSDAALPTTETIGVNDTVAVGTSVAAAGPRPITVALSPTGATKVFLERLADPSKPLEEINGTNPFVTVDELAVTVWADETSAKRSVRGGTGSYWKTTTATRSGNTPAAPDASTTADWFHWPNRPFISNVELALVPSGSPSEPTKSGSEMLANFSVPTNSLVNVPVIGQLIIDATYVPSRFAGTAFAAGSLDPMLNPLNNHGLTKLHHLSRWREPGKTNVNTIVSGTNTSQINLDDVVWTTLTGGTAANRFSSSPAERDSALVTGGPGNPGVITRETFVTGPRSRNPFFEYYLASRLANTATVRSQMFAVWVTVRVTDDSPNAPPPLTKRMFAIIDRSIPVGYSPGEDLNVSDCIRLKRYLD